MRVKKINWKRAGSFFVIPMVSLSLVQTGAYAAGSTTFFQVGSQTVVSEAKPHSRMRTNSSQKALLPWCRVLA
ncbi:hypothetical protein [Effusibacillus lacus]|uniref:hypothetical protein n=1 Tax=Effusibacillus lacus TaxID=1348429 RepID=UPI0010F0256C|nr:hypothetical protein [Effusibacillus lacus]TCS76105.1 hypothetical protein EDD64_10477 [Effusibacillus lacus]